MTLPFFFLADDPPLLSGGCHRHQPFPLVLFSCGNIQFHPCMRIAQRSELQDLPFENPASSVAGNLRVERTYRCDQGRDQEHRPRESSILLSLFFSSLLKNVFLLGVFRWSTTDVASFVFLPFSCFDWPIRFHIACRDPLCGAGLSLFNSLPQLLQAGTL